jgi:signal transduction histidine kinase
MISHRPLCIIICALLNLSSLIAQERRPITNSLEVLKLSPAKAEENRPVHLQGAVTCYVPASQLCFVQTPDAGIFILPAPWPKELAFGDVVEVDGVTASGRFSPIVQWATIRRTGARANPVPRRVAIEELNTGAYDCQFVEIEGVVQAISFRPDVAVLRLQTGGSSAKVLVYGQAVSTNLVDARVRLQGVGGTFYSESLLAGFGLFVVTREGLKVLEPAPGLSTVPLRTTSTLTWYSPNGALDHRIRLRGVVTVPRRNKAFFLADKGGGIRVDLRSPATVQAGDEVEVAGFLRDPMSEPYLAESIIRQIEHKPLALSPTSVTVPQLETLRPSGDYVRASGTILALETEGTNDSKFLIESGGQTVPIIAAGGLQRETQPGAQVTVTGAWGKSTEDQKLDWKPALWLASSNSVRITALARPALSSSSGTYLFLLVPSCAALFVIGAGFGLLGWQRRKQAIQEAQAALAQLGEAERELRQMAEARERLGRDLHDHIIQAIYAVGLNIDDCTHLLEKEPQKAEARLRTALLDVNAVIREIRNVILGLESNAIQPQEFRAALKSLALALGNDKSNRMRLDLNEEALAALSPVQSTELIHIAREALSNSIRHGHAETMSFALELLEDKIRFSIGDDGQGFDPATQDSHGFGLRNMSKRAQNLGAKFTIESQKGCGTRILLDIPRQKQHFSGRESRAGANR